MYILDIVLWVMCECKYLMALWKLGLPSPLVLGHKEEAKVKWELLFSFLLLINLLAHVANYKSDRT